MKNIQTVKKPRKKDLNFHFTYDDMQDRLVPLHGTRLSLSNFIELFPELDYFKVGDTRLSDWPIKAIGSFFVHKDFIIQQVGSEFRGIPMARYFVIMAFNGVSRSGSGPHLLLVPEFGHLDNDAVHIKVTRDLERR